jgi:hypothetical protein
MVEEFFYIYCFFLSYLAVEIVLEMSLFFRERYEL